METFTCCSGTYIQNIADYHNLIYLKDSNALYVNLFLPSEVTWTRAGRRGAIVQETDYPDADTTRLTISPPSRRAFRAAGSRAVLDARHDCGRERRAGRASTRDPAPGPRSTRTWTSGDRVDIRIPLTLRMQAVAPQYPDRVAVVRGPVVLALEGAYHDPNFRLPMRDEDLRAWLVPEKGSLPRGIWSVGMAEPE